MAINNQVKQKEFVNEDQVGSKGISYNTVGTTLQALSVQLDANEEIYSDAGKMSWMTDNVEMSTHGQGCSKMLSRMFTRETIFVNRFTCTEGTGIVTFTTDQAGKVIPLELSPDKPGIVFQKGAYLCSENGIERKIAFTKRIGAGLFGGKGFILQKVEGQGKVHLVADGEAVMYELKEGQEMIVDQGNLVAYEDTVDFDIRTVKGAKNWLFGGEGLFTAVLKGPGKVWLQTRKFRLTRGMQYNQYNSANAGGAQRIIGCVVSMAIFGIIMLASILSSL